MIGRRRGPRLLLGSRRGCSARLRRLLTGGGDEGAPGSTYESAHTRIDRGALLRRWPEERIEEMMGMVTTTKLRGLMSSELGGDDEAS